MADGLLRAANLDRLAIEPNLAAGCRVRAEDRLGQFGPPGADQPGHAQDLACVQREADVVHVVAAAEVAHFEHDIAEGGWLRRSYIWPTSRPTIMRMMSSVVTSATGVPTSMPSRRR